MKTTAGKTPDDTPARENGEMTDEEMVEMVLQLPDTLTLWSVRGDYQRPFAVIPIPKRRTKKTKRAT